MTEKEKMLKGELYDPSDPELTALREKGSVISKAFNDTTENEVEKRYALLKEWGVTLGPNAYIRGAVQFDYGCFTSIGENTFINFNFTCLDCCPVTIGRDVFMGPNISILTPLHPLRWQERNVYCTPDGRRVDKEYAKPVTIEKNCWIGGNVTICGGVTIGEGSVIGAGSVVTRDIPPNMLAAGVPCRVIRPITEADSMTRPVTETDGVTHS